MYKNVVIICRSENPTVDFKKTSLRGLLTWGLHLEQKYLIKRLPDKASIRKIKARIHSIIMMPEWIGNHRFGIFDLLNKEFILRIEKAALSYNHSALYAFFPLLSKGYSMSESLDFLRIRTELIKNELSNSCYFSKRRFRKIKLGYIEELLEKASN